MSKSDKSRKHAFKGQDSAEMVLKWLTQAGIPENNEVMQLMTLNAQFRAERDLRAVPLDRPAGQQIVEHIHDTVSKWRLGWAPVADYKAAPLADISIELRPTADTRTVNPLLWNAYWHAVLLLQKNLLHRVRRCETCGSWFFAKFEKARFDSDLCRVQILSTDPNYRSRRAQYMKDLRKGKKNRKHTRKGGK